MRLLIVEDDPGLRRMLKRGLVEEGHEVLAVPDGERALAALLAGGLDACILDILLPGMDGFAVLDQARQAGVTTPVILLTARDAIPDRVRGLQLGADDYLTKPFAFAELVARLEARTRRAATGLTRLRSGTVELDCEAHLVFVAGAPVDLSAKQFALLEFLLRNRGKIVTRAMLLEQVFGYRFDPGTNLVDVHIANLRQRLGPAAAQLSSVRGVGYRLDDELA